MFSGLLFFFFPLEIRTRTLFFLRNSFGVEEKHCIHYFFAYVGGLTMDERAHCVGDIERADSNRMNCTHLYIMLIRCEKQLSRADLFSAVYIKMSWSHHLNAFTYRVPFKVLVIRVHVIIPSTILTRSFPCSLRFFGWFCRKRCSRAKAFSEFTPFAHTLIRIRTFVPILTHSTTTPHHSQNGYRS